MALRYVTESSSNRLLQVAPRLSAKRSQIAPMTLAGAVPSPNRPIVFAIAAGSTPFCSSSEIKIAGPAVQVEADRQGVVRAAVIERYRLAWPAVGEALAGHGPVWRSMVMACHL